MNQPSKADPNDYTALRRRFKVEAKDMITKGDERFLKSIMKDIKKSQTMKLGNMLKIAKK